MRQPAAARWAGWLTMARISNSPTVVSNVLAGAALAGGADPGSIALLAVAMVVFYTAGMLLNDVCDYGWDLTHRPDRPLVRGLVSYRAAVMATIALFALGLLLLWPLGVRTLISGVILSGFIVLYDTWHKTNPLSPLVMGACRVMVYVTAFVSVAWPPTLLLTLGSLFLLLHLIGLTALAKSEARPSVADYWPAAVLFLPGLYFILSSPILAVANMAWVGFSVRTVYRRHDRRIGLAIGRLIAGISLLDALIIAAVGGSLAWIALAVLAFGLTLLLQRYVEGT
jgi:UbiA prenyltransferase family